MNIFRTRTETCESPNELTIYSHFADYWDNIQIIAI